MHSREHMNAIRRFPVQKGSVAIWWLGQNGWIFKSPEGIFDMPNKTSTIFPDSVITSIVKDWALQVVQV